jgi:hypothetical protein
MKDGSGSGAWGACGHDDSALFYDVVVFQNEGQLWWEFSALRAILSF